MPKLPSVLEACRADLFTSDSELAAKYPAQLAERVSRIREMYNYWLANPSMKDRQLRDTIMSRFSVAQSTAYADISVIHQLAPLLSQKSRDFHRLRFNEMVLETYNMAKARKDAKAMGQAMTAYAKFNRIDLEDEMSMPYEKIVVQPFVPSLDPTLLGIKPIPDIVNFIARLTKDLSRDFADIVDVEAEEADLQDNLLFAPIDGTD